MTTTEILRLLFLLLAGHGLGDFALQTEWIATNKNRHVKNTVCIWPHLLTAHSLIHGMIVYMITGKIILGILETIAHWITDFSKCEGWFNFHTDQFMHLFVKIIWLILLAFELIPF